MLKKTNVACIGTKATCLADCSNCHTFPAPFRRIGEADCCEFSQHTLIEGESITFNKDRMVRILFLTSGSLELTIESNETRTIEAKQCVCLARGEVFVLTPREKSQFTLLSLIHRVEFCEQDIFDRDMPFDTAVRPDAAPVLPLPTQIENLLLRLFDLQALSDCTRFQRLKATELFMMIKVLYTPLEHAYFFQSLIQPQDNFRVFVCNNYDRVRGVPELAALAGMSLSVFKRRFSEHFDDSVYHWMMRQKALKIFADIRAGEDSTKALMNKHKFRYYTQFSRFCKTYLQATPAQLIASIKEG
ncbi:MAG: AraC family transcriptional regulator [Alistipes sp.]